MALFCLSVYVTTAQDFIVTKQSQRIDCKVEEISETEIKYRAKTDLTGEIVTIKASNVASVIFENGEVFIPQNNADTDVDDVRSQSHQSEESINSENPITDNKTDGASKVVKANEKVPPFKDGEYIVRKGQDWYYGDYELGRRDLSDFFEAYCPAARKKLKRCRVWGTLTAVFSSAAILGSSVFFGMTVADIADGYSDNITGLTSSISLLASSCALFIFGVNLKVTAEKRSVHVFNEQCRSDRSLSINAAPAGIGLTYNF